MLIMVALQIQRSLQTEGGKSPFTSCQSWEEYLKKKDSEEWNKEMMQICSIFDKGREKRWKQKQRGLQLVLEIVVEKRDLSLFPAN